MAYGGAQVAIAKPAGPAVEILENPVLVSPDPDRVDLFVGMDDKVLYTVSKAGDVGGCYTMAVAWWRDTRHSWSYVLGSEWC